MPRQVALVTAREALPLDEDMPPLVEACRAAGMAVETPAWDDPSVDWGGFEAAVLRSTWDYADRSGEFLQWVDRCARATRLFNAPEVVRWNLDKHYLLELHAAGVPVVPTLFVEPGEAAGEALSAFLDGRLSAGQPEDFDEFVIKPAIGAGSRDALRLSRGEGARAQDHLARLLEAGRSAMLQPYLRRVDEEGETALVHLGGGFSPAMRSARGRCCIPAGRWSRGCSPRRTSRRARPGRTSSRWRRAPARSPGVGARFMSAWTWSGPPMGDR